MDRRQAGQGPLDATWYGVGSSRTISKVITEGLSVELEREEMQEMQELLVNRHGLPESVRSCPGVWL